MIPKLKQAAVRPAGIARAGLEIVAAGVLEDAVDGRILVGDPFGRRVLAITPEEDGDVLALMQRMRVVAQSLQRTRVEQAWTWTRSWLASAGARGWQLPEPLAHERGRAVFLFHGMNMKRGLVDAVKRARARYGVRVVQYLHDLLPITHPGEYTGGRMREFRRYVSELLSSCDLVITSSRATAGALPAIAPLLNGRVPPVAVVPLAHEYRPWQSGSVRPALPELADREFVLCVGSISVRKNQLGLLQAWERYSAATRRPRAAHLVLAGQSGHGASEVLSFLERTDRVGGTVHLVAQPSDPELTWLYENCRFTAYVSFAEGFGLPIGESLWLGKTCLASATTSMPEVGGDCAVYVDPHSVDEMAAQLTRLLDEPGYADAFAQRIATAKLRSWRDFRRDLVDAIRLHDWA
jgi:glycosyltransferase involved in cell wall biosynthesis